jgi:transposase
MKKHAESALLLLRRARFINKIKHYRRIATRFEKTARNFFSMLVLAAAMIWLRKPV